MKSELAVPETFEFCFHLFGYRRINLRSCQNLRAWYRNGLANLQESVERAKYKHCYSDKQSINLFGIVVSKDGTKNFCLKGRNMKLRH